MRSQSFVILLMSYEHDSREYLFAQPYPEDWESYLLRNVAHFRVLSEAERARLRTDTRILVEEKNWESCGGLHVTDEMKVTIAAQACLMLLGIEHDYYSRVPSILVYPTTFVIPHGEWLDEYDPENAAAGQAVYRGPVILAWDAVLAEGRDPSAGNNVVIHEFAHQFDFLDDSFNGTPDLSGMDEAERWYEVMTAEYTRLRRHVRQGRNTFLGDYAAKDELEFFAVASERFFTQPVRLRHYHPPLYRVLAEFYRVEPIVWFPINSGGT
jgi:Mlc titration factor MtfA (ptsG expression regulator)